MYSTGIPDTKTLCDNGWLTIREIVDTVNSKISPDKITENIVRHYSGRKIIDPGIIAPAMIMIGKGRRRAKLYPLETVGLIIRVRELLVSGWTASAIFLISSSIAGAFRSGGFLQSRRIPRITSVTWIVLCGDA